MSRVLVASIRDLCGADHGGDSAVIARWTANKTPENIGRWLAAGVTLMFVAEDDGGAIVGVASCTRDGAILLNYVAPEARFRGISKAMLGRMEDELRAAGIAEVTLAATATAEAFYRAAGWQGCGEEASPFGGGPCRLMRKALAPAGTA